MSARPQCPGPPPIRPSARALLLLVPLLGAPLPAAAGFEDGAVRWRELGPGLAEARREGKPVFMVVYIDRCEPCREYAGLFQRPQVVQALGRFVPVLVDGRREPREKDYRPDGAYVPRSLVLDPDGRLIKQVTGPYQQLYFLPPDSPEYLLDFLDRGLGWADWLANSGKLPPAEPSRKAAPGAGVGTAASRAEGGTGPVRRRAPQWSEPEPAPGAAAPAGAAPDGGIRGLLRRLIGLFS